MFSFPKCIGIARIAALLAGLGGLSVIAGWLFGIEFLTTWVAGTVSMKFSTAICFVASALVLHCLSKIAEGNLGLTEVVVSFSSLVLLLLMFSLLLAYFFNVETGIEHLFVRESANAAFAGLPGRPALLTIGNFIAIALAGILSFTGAKWLGTLYSATGILVFLLGGVSLAAYLFGSQMFLLFEGIAPPMAVNTALLFGILGTGFAALGKGCENAAGVEEADDGAAVLK